MHVAPFLVFAVLAFAFVYLAAQVIAAIIGWQNLALCMVVASWIGACVGTWWVTKFPGGRS